MLRRAFLLIGPVNSGVLLAFLFWGVTLAAVSARQLLGGGGGVPPPPYQGPLDVAPTNPWDHYWGMIAYSHAYAAANSPVGIVTRASDSATCTVPFLTSGTPDLTVTSPCATNTLTVTAFCTAGSSHCTWTSWTDQGAVGGNNQIEPGSNPVNGPTLTLSGCIGLTAMVSCAAMLPNGGVSGGPQYTITTSTMGQPHAAPYSAMAVGRSITGASGTVPEDAFEYAASTANHILFSDQDYCNFNSNQFGPIATNTAGWRVMIDVSGTSGTCNVNSATVAANTGSQGITSDAIFAWGADGNTAAHGWDGQMLVSAITFQAITGSVSAGNMQAIINNLRTTAGF